MKKILTVLCLLFTGCTTSFPEAGSCWVKWSKLEYRYKYQQGLGKTREEKSEKHLLFPIWQNGGIYVTEKGARFDISDANGDKFINKFIEKNIVTEDHDHLERVYNAVMSLEFRVSILDLKDMLKGYEKVDCTEYSESQYL